MSIFVFVKLLVMKKYLSLLLLFFFLYAFGGALSAYTPNSSDDLFVDKASQAIEQNVEQDDNQPKAMVERYYILGQIADRSSKIRVDYLVWELQDYVRIMIDEAKYEQFREPINGLLDTYTDLKETFIPYFSDDIVTLDIPMNHLCDDHIQFIDDRSFAENISTALVLATRQMEASCRRYLPRNGDWPFQIVSNDYGTGELTTWTMIQAIQDFAWFSRAKRWWFEWRNPYPSQKITLTYNEFSLKSLITHWSLYNGLSWSIYQTETGQLLPNNPDYVFGQRTAEYSDAVKDGLLVNFWKALQIIPSPEVSDR